MTSYVRVSNRMVTCPYDESHRLKESKMQMHIAKCKLSHLEIEKKVCPFNAQHRINPAEFQYHLINCPNNDVVDKKAVADNNYKGFTGVPCYSQDIPITGECWDAELAPTATSLYTPKKLPPNNGIIEPEPMSKPAERRKLYKKLHSMPRDFENEKDSTETASLSDSTIKTSFRQDKNNEALQNQIKLDEKSLLNIGLGRAASSRIAANFSGAKPMAEPVVSSDIAHTISMLGTGRGRSNPASFPAFQDSDFPALGLNRGMRPGARKF